jgi:hypothetical protein
MKLYYAGFTPSGELVTLQDNAHDAEEALIRMGEAGSATLVETAGSEDPYVEQYQRNPPGRMATKALERSGLPRLRVADIDRISPKEALDRLQPIAMKLWSQRGYSAWKKKKGRPTGKPPGWATTNSPHTFAESFLGTNIKLAKSAKTPASNYSYGCKNAEFRGLNLLPAGKLNEAANWFDATQYWQKMPLTRSIKGAGNKPWKKPHWSLCAGSSPHCRESCLVFSGQNKQLPNMAKKAALTMMLMSDPAAFMRLLRDAFYAFVGCELGKGHAAFIRLNLLSDIPWELVAPWFFDDLPPNAIAYDYTKIAGRHHPRYDLTFSFSGPNERQCKRELESGKRIAAVFMGFARDTRQGKVVDKFITSQNINVAFPKRINMFGRDCIVTDADINDARPFDPAYGIVGDYNINGLIQPRHHSNAPSICALRWKNPGKDLNAIVRKRGYSFVTPLYYTEGEYVGTSRRNPRMQSGGFLLAPVTPRAQGLPFATEPLMAG